MKSSFSRIATRRAASSIAVFTAALAFALPAAAVTYHIRPDGGTAEKCTGLANAAYPGSGTGRACAWSGVLVALPPGGIARFAGGDTLLIHTGSYMVGYGAPGADSCSTSWTYDCFPAPLPSGTQAKPTRILGEGYNGTCAAPPELWGTERISRILNLQGTSHASIACLEITDHSDCVVAHTGSLTCSRGAFPNGDYADNGIYAADSSNISLSKINIHGVAHYGIHAGRLHNWTVDNVTLRGNGWGGWNGDFGEDINGDIIDSSNSGTLLFTNFLVEYNGCGETYPGLNPAGCWNDKAVGYGDGLGTGATGGDWIFRDSTFRYNTSDGIDLLYHERGGTVTVDRVRATGNAGNQIKTMGNTRITNAIVHANCGYFSRTNLTYIYTPPEPDIPGRSVADCRAGGDAIAVVAKTPIDQISIVNTTIVSEGNVVVLTGGPLGSRLTLRNNIFVPLNYFLDPAKKSGDTYPQSEMPLISIDESHALKQANPVASPMKCDTPSAICVTDAGLKAATATRFDPHLKPNSPARNSALNSASEPLVPVLDYFKNPRGLDGFYDRGASEDEPTESRAERKVH